MKIGLFTDVHWTQYSSIIRKRGDKYSYKLENLINSMNWVENLFASKYVNMEVCLGDFFDKPTLNSEEITALQDVRWNSNNKFFIVGNHESEGYDLSYSSTNIFPFNVFNTPQCMDADDCNIYFIPYTKDKFDLKDYIIDDYSKPRIIFSHNDIAGIKYGAYLSTNGFDLKDIENNCDLFINGHLHNGMFLNDKETILNLGNLTGLNFTEDAFKYKHFACILDTSTMKLEFYENPYALKFYSIEIKNEDDFKILSTLSENSVVSIKCCESLLSALKDKIQSLETIVESRLIVERDKVEYTQESGEEFSNVQYLDKFVECVYNIIGTSDIVKEELSEVCK